MAVVVFDPEKFRILHPAFSDEVKFPDETLQFYFDLAVEFVGNTDADSFAPYDPDNKIYTCLLYTSDAADE